MKVFLTFIEVPSPVGIRLEIWGQVRISSLAGNKEFLSERYIVSQILSTAECAILTVTYLYLMSFQ